MGFLDNSGDIILDAVTTTIGRARAAAGNGTFNIKKFALADDEINYELYDINNQNGNAYYDLQILQTPVLEAFTNTASTMRSKLVSMNRNNVLYMPILKLFQLGAYANYSSLNTYIIPVNKTTVLNLTNQGAGNLQPGILNGNGPASVANAIALDQGQETPNLVPVISIRDDLRESAFLVEIDDRFGRIFSESGGRSGGYAATWSFRDDDNVATYNLSGGPWITNIDAGIDVESSIENGRRGVRLAFKILASTELNSSVTLFNQIGTTGTTAITNTAGNGGELAASEYKYIDSVVRVTGLYTGYRLDIPVRFVRST